MRKIDFEKIERDIDEVMRNMSVKDWLELAAISNLIGGVTIQKIEKDKTQESEDQLPKEPRQDMIIEKIIMTTNVQLDSIEQVDQEFYTQLEISAEDRAKFLNPKNMLPQDWIKLKELREKLSLYMPPKKEEDQITEEKKAIDDEKYVEKERVKHKRKRFNVRESWWPLDTQK